MVIKRYYSWNILSCIAGSLCAASLFMIMFIMFQSLTGSEYILAGGGFTKVLTMVALPALFWGLSFWLIAVYKNKNIDHLMQKKIENSEMMMANFQDAA